MINLEKKRADSLPASSICACRQVKTLVPGHMTRQEIKPTSKLEPKPRPNIPPACPTSCRCEAEIQSRQDIKKTLGVSGSGRTAPPSTTPSPPPPPKTDSAFMASCIVDASPRVCFLRAVVSFYFIRFPPPHLEGLRWQRD